MNGLMLGMHKSGFIHKNVIYLASSVTDEHHKTYLCIKKAIIPRWRRFRLISAGTRTRSLWIRSPARYSIAPQRLSHMMQRKARSYCASVPHPAASGPVPCACVSASDVARGRARASLVWRRAAMADSRPQHPKEK